MGSMYDKIKQLPLFQGLSTQQISNFLEKTAVTITKYNAKDTLVKDGESIKSLKCLISGSVEFSYQVNDCLKIKERINSPSILFGERMFGMDTSSNIELVSCGKSGVMEISKEQYMKLLMSDSIYLMNYLNYLSIRAQSAQWELPSTIRYKNISEMIADIISNCIVRDSTQVEFIFSLDKLSQWLGLEINSISKELNFFEESGFIQLNETGLTVLDKKDFLNYIKSVDQIEEIGSVQNLRNRE